MPNQLSFLQPGRIGTLPLKNRLIRAATSESMASPSGAGAEDLVRLYSDLARGGAGLIMTGHIFVEPDGRYEPRQTGLYHDDLIEPLRLATDAVHREGGLIFAELSHAGSQSIAEGVQPVAPSPVVGIMSGRPPAVMTAGDIARVTAAFKAAAARAVRAGFDGIHIHSGNGYLLSQFNSPVTNRRVDAWGGNAASRSRFLLEVYRAIREATPAHFPVTARLGLADAVPGGLVLQDGLVIARQLADEGLDALEVSLGLMESYRQNIRPHAGVTPLRALAEGIFAPLVKPYVEEAYFRDFARAAKAAVSIPIILIGGLRSTPVMDDVIRSGDADFLALARPFVREPDLVRKIEQGRLGPVKCVSCNLCLKHEGIDALRCWRTPRGIAQHVYRWYLKRERGASN